MPAVVLGPARFDVFPPPGQPEERGQIGGQGVVQLRPSGPAPDGDEPPAQLRRERPGPVARRLHETAGVAHPIGQSRELGVDQPSGGGVPVPVGLLAGRRQPLADQIGQPLLELGQSGGHVALSLGRPFGRRLGIDGTLAARRPPSGPLHRALPQLGRPVPGECGGHRGVGHRSVVGRPQHQEGQAVLARKIATRAGALEGGSVQFHRDLVGEFGAAQAFSPHQGIGAPEL